MFIYKTSYSDRFWLFADDKPHAHSDLVPLFSEKLMNKFSRSKSLKTNSNFYKKNGNVLTIIFSAFTPNLLKKIVKNIFLVFRMCLCHNFVCLLTYYVIKFLIRFFLFLHFNFCANICIKFSNFSKIVFNIILFSNFIR